MQPSPRPPPPVSLGTCTASENFSPEYNPRGLLHSYMPSATVFYLLVWTYVCPRFLGGSRKIGMQEDFERFDWYLFFHLPRISRVITLFTLTPPPPTCRISLHRQPTHYYPPCLRPLVLKQSGPLALKEEFSLDRTRSARLFVRERRRARLNPHLMYYLSLIHI